MNPTGLLMGLFIALCVVIPAQAATPVHKCLINGTVTFQRDPCPSNRPRNDPTPERLNSERKARMDSAASAAGAGDPSGAVVGAGGRAPAVHAPAPDPAPVQDRFRCDGRTYCSQMKSCAEAKYFLAHCPAVKMDGDRNGVPCERQWCSQ